MNGTSVASTGDGAVELEMKGDWTKPKEFLTHDVSDIGSVSAMKEADGVLYLASLGAGSKPFVALDLADAGRGILTQLASVDIGATVNAIIVSGDYLYLGTNADTGELIVLRRTDLSVVRTLDLAGNTDTLSLYATGTRLYLGRAQSTQPELYQLDITNPTAGIPTISSVDFTGGITAVAGAAQYMFLGTTANVSELLVVRTSDLGVANTLDLTSNADVTSLLVSGNTLYLSRAQSTAQEVARVDITSPLLPLATNGGANVSASVLALSLGADGRLYVATALPASEVIVYTLPAFTFLSAHDISLGAGARSVLSVGPYVYLGMENNNPELVVLRGGSGQWANPVVQGSYNATGNSDGQAVAVSGNFAYVGTLANGSAAEFAVIDVSNSATPLRVGSLEIGADVNSVVVSGPYAYLATSDNSREFIAVNVSNPANPTLLGVYNSPGNVDGTSVSASGTLALLGTKSNSSASELYLLNVANPASPSLSAQAEVGDDANDVVFTPGGFVLAAASNNAKELIVFDARVSGALTEVSSYNTTGTADGLGLALFGGGGANVALTTQTGSTWNFYIFTLNLTNGSLAQNSFLGLSGSNYKVAVANDLAFVTNDLSSGGLAIVNVSNIGAPQLVGTLPLLQKVNDVAVSTTYAYLATVDNTREFIITAPAALSLSRAEVGWHTSSAFDAGALSPLWGTLSWQATGTGQTSLQIRTSGTQAGLQSASWVGPSGVRGGAFATSGGAVTPDLGADGVEWIQYRAKLSGDALTTPAVTDVTITYN